MRIGRSVPAAAFMIPLVLAGMAAALEAIPLVDGSVIQGEIIRREDGMVTIRTTSLGEIRVLEKELASPGATSAVPASNSAADSARSSRGKADRPASDYAGEPADQALFFLPTAFTPPARSFSFRDFELFFLTFGFSPSSSTSLSIGGLFPITPEFQLLTAGAKQRLWMGRSGLTALALTANITKPVGEASDEVSLLATGNMVASMRFAPSGKGQAEFGIHAVFGYAGAQSRRETYDDIEGDYEYRNRWDGAFSHGLGGEVRLSRNSKFLAEYLSAFPFDPDNESVFGLLTVGFRLHGERLAADIAGTRPITDSDMGSFFMWPLLVVSYRI